MISVVKKNLVILAVAMVASASLAGDGPAWQDSEHPAVAAWNPSAVQPPTEYLIRTTGEGDNSIDEIVVPGRLPKTFRASAVTVPAPNEAAGINVLANVPAFDWSYGCAPTAAAMMMGYYDNGAYSDTVSYTHLTLPTTPYV